MGMGVGMGVRRCLVDKPHLVLFVLLHAVMMHDQIARHVLDVVLEHEQEFAQAKVRPQVSDS